MPVDRTVADDLTRTLVQLYGDIQTRLVADLGRQLAAGLDRPEWADQKLAALSTLERHLRHLIAGLDTAAQAEIEQTLMLAYVRGGRAALDEVTRLQLTPAERLALGNQVDGMAQLAALAGRRRTALATTVQQVRRVLPGVDALQRLAFSLASRLAGTHLPILRWSLDAYRQVIGAGAAPEVLLGIQTRRRAAQVAWEQLLRQGISSFTDRAGRRWELASYVEMATRTVVAQAAVQGHLDRLGQADLDLVIVSNAPQECKRCRPWEGKILARSGADGAREVVLEHATRDGEMVHVQVAGSVDEAVAKGLMHPNCRHSLSAYLPGITKPPTNTEDPQGDEARQTQRALEREIRAEKRILAGMRAFGPDPATEAKIRALQGRMREHLAANPDLFRKPERERIGTAR